MNWQYSLSRKYTPFLIFHKSIFFIITLQKVFVFNMMIYFSLENITSLFNITFIPEPQPWFHIQSSSLDPFFTFSNSQIYQEANETYPSGPHPCICPLISPLFNSEFTNLHSISKEDPPPFIQIIENLGTTKPWSALFLYRNQEKVHANKK